MVSAGSRMAERASGTEGYAEQAESLIPHYESLSFEEVHASVLHLLPDEPGRALDIGAGTGRDAGALAAMGHDVVAVEPTLEFRSRAQELHPSPRIDWVDDSLPALQSLADRGGVFDLVLSSAVWMHLDEGQRRHAMPNVARLLRPGGLLVLSLRHGPVPAGRRMFEVTADETIDLARAEGLDLLVHVDRQVGPRRQPDVLWTRLAFRRPDA